MPQPVLIYVLDNTIDPGSSHQFWERESTLDIKFTRDVQIQTAEVNAVLLIDSMLHQAPQFKRAFPALKLIAYLVEPASIANEHYSFVKDHSDLFDAVLTHDVARLNLPQSMLCTFGTTWIPREQQGLHVTEKTKLVSLVASWKKMTPGHRLRHDIIAQDHQHQISVMGNGTPTPLDNKHDAHIPYMYSIVCENTNDGGDYFSEKLVDCFLTGCIPIYFGGKNVLNYFNADGILSFQTAEDMVAILPKLSKTDYEARASAVADNFERARQYASIMPSVRKCVGNIFGLHDNAPAAVEWASMGAAAIMARFVPKQHHHQSKIAILIPTRERPHKIQTLHTEWFKLTNASIHTDCIIILDADNEAAYPRLEGFRYLVVNTNGQRGMNVPLNAAAKFLCYDYDYIGFWGDDNLPRTRDWNLRMLDVLVNQGSFSMVYGNDLLQGPNLPCQIIMDSLYVKYMGYMAYPKLTHLYTDNFWKYLGQKLNNIHYVHDVIIEHVHYAVGKALPDNMYIINNETSNSERNRLVFESIPNDAAFNKLISQMLKVSKF